MKSIKPLKNRFSIIIESVVLSLVFVFGISAFGQSNTINVDHFDKVIISPHIQVNFIEGDEESVTIKTNKISNEKLNIEVTDKTLRVYLDGAKMVTKSEKHKTEKWKGKRSIYQGTIVTATVTYKTINELSLRGEETFVCESLLEMEKFRLKIYGETKVYLNEVKLETLHTTIYGESLLEIKSGTIKDNKFKCYGGCKLKTLGVNSKAAKVTAYGDGNFWLNVSDKLRVTSYGEAVISYEGNPNVSKGVVIGETTINKI